MRLPLTVRSNDYKGLLVLSKRDRIIDIRERNLLLQIGEILDFDRRFCNSTIDDLLSNIHISRKPVIFSNDTIQECFFRDSLRVALVDGSFHQLESRWLRSVAHSNGRTDRWLDAIIQEFEENKSARDHSAPFEIQQHL
jgi:hypothetical protein